MANCNQLFFTAANIIDIVLRTHKFSRGIQIILKQQIYSAVKYQLKVMEQPTSATVPSIDALIHNNQLQDTQADNTQLIQDGDTVILYLGVSNLKQLKLSHGDAIHLHFGHFKHSDIIGRKFGTKFVSSSHPSQFFYALKPTPSLITDSLSRKTQILFEMDIASILFRLNILPGLTVVEAGTGSGSLSSAFATTIGASGHLYTFEFNKERAQITSRLFKDLGFDNITVTHQDIIQGAFTVQGVDYEADALFLDVPNPWDAIVNAKKVLKKDSITLKLTVSPQDGRICCFSPCIEQVQRTCLELRKNNFHMVETYECLNRPLERRDKNLYSYTKNGEPIEGDSVLHYSAGPKEIRGHTGYLTFAYLY